MIKKEGCISFKKVAYNVKVLCAVGDFGNGTFDLPQSPIEVQMLN